MELTKSILVQFLNETNVKDEYIHLLTDNIDQYQVAFTAPSYNPITNYEMYEMLGDSTANEAMVWYFYNLFPQLHCPQGVKIIARLKINNSNTESFSAFSKRLGFLPYIRALPEELEDEDVQLKIMEDVFEAFIGVTKLTLVEKFGYMGVGNQIVFNMIKTLMDERNIVLDPEELYDTKTRLKELFDKRDIQNMYGKLKYIYTEKPKTVKIFFVQNGNFVFISQGEGNTKAIQEKDAARKALEFLKSQGVETEKKFRLFCSNFFNKQ